MEFIITTRIPLDQPVAGIISATAFCCTETELPIYWLAMSPEQRRHSSISAAVDQLPIIEVYHDARI